MPAYTNVYRMVAQGADATRGPFAGKEIVKTAVGQPLFGSSDERSEDPIGVIRDANWVDGEIVLDVATFGTGVEAGLDRVASGPCAGLFLMNHVDYERDTLVPHTIISAFMCSPQERMSNTRVLEHTMEYSVPAKL